MKKHGINRILAVLVLSVMLVTAFVPVTAAEATDVTANLTVGGVCQVNGQLYLTDRYSRAVYTVTNGALVPFIGQTDEVDVTGRPHPDYRDGAFSEVRFGEPCGIVPYQKGFLVADKENNVLRYADLSKQRIYTLAGSGKAGFSDGSGEKAAFDRPAAMVVGDDGRIYISDSGNHAIRVMDGQGRVSTYLGGTEGNTLGKLDETKLSYPAGLCYADGALYIADAGNHRILKVENGVCTLVAGAELTGDEAIEGGHLNGPAEVARFASPMAVTAVGDDLYVADTANGALRLIRDGYVCDVGGFDIPLIAPDAFFTVDGITYVADSFHRSAQPLPEMTEITYSDINGEKHADAIRFVTVNGLMQGTGEGKFSPELSVTRGMILTVLARYEGMDTSAAEPWYAIGVSWGLENGISDGTNPQDNITFEQLLTMLYRYAGQPEVTGNNAPAGTSAYAEKAVTWAIEKGIAGKDGLQPKGYPTRADTAAMLEAFLLGR